GKLTSHFSLTYIKNAQMLPAVRTPSDAERAAIRLLVAVAEAGAFELRVAPPDPPLLNNHAGYHARPALTADAGSGQARLPAPLGLAMPNARALPGHHAVLWRDVEAGRARGGIAQPAVAVVA